MTSERPIERNVPLAELVVDRPELAPVLDELRLDYCCHGRLTLDEACATSGHDIDAVLARLTALEPSLHRPAWVGLTPGQLTEHIEEDHHGYLRGALPRLQDLGERVVATHAERHPETVAVLRTLVELRSRLEPHLALEEQVVFPLIRAHEHAADHSFPSRESGQLETTIDGLDAEHDVAGALVATLRLVTDGFVAPPDGCASFRLFYDGLAELEADLHLHVHKENHLLFPAAVERERTFDPSDARGPDHAMTHGECWAALATTSVGRLAVSGDDGDIDVFPVNFVVDRTGVVFSTAPGTKLDRLIAEQRCTFEADGFDFYEGIAWSVVARGRPEPLRPVADELAGPLPRPFQPGSKPISVRLIPDRLTGRRFAIDAGAGYTA